jgi:hypothetical protein
LNFEKSKLKMSRIQKESKLKNIQKIDFKQRTSNFEEHSYYKKFRFFNNVLF